MVASACVISSSYAPLRRVVSRAPPRSIASPLTCGKLLCIRALGFFSWLSGTVEVFNTTKGFGVTSPETAAGTHSSLISAVQRSDLENLYENKVEYELEQGRDGKESATKLKLLDWYYLDAGALHCAHHPPIAPRTIMVVFFLTRAWTRNGLLSVTLGGSAVAAITRA
ncbi:MAG: cold-shock protein [Mesorhizobium sp.]|nr:cold shock domain-containing protein [Mesorhizobium sp.]TIM31733.1 MAG: cold-shock protein [Mesorhizobium sp.]